MPIALKWNFKHRFFLGGALYSLTLQISVLTNSSSISRDRLVFGCEGGVVNLPYDLFGLFSESYENLPLRSYACIQLKLEISGACVQFPDGSFYRDEHFLINLSFTVIAITLINL